MSEAAEEETCLNTAMTGPVRGVPAGVGLRVSQVAVGSGGLDRRRRVDALARYDREPGITIRAANRR